MATRMTDSIKQPDQPWQPDRGSAGCGGSVLEFVAARCLDRVYVRLIFLLQQLPYPLHRSVRVSHVNRLASDRHITYSYLLARRACTTSPSKKKEKKRARPGVEGPGHVCVALWGCWLRGGGVASEACFALRCAFSHTHRGLVSGVSSSC